MGRSFGILRGSGGLYGALARAFGRANHTNTQTKRIFFHAGFLHKKVRAFPALVLANKPYVAETVRHETSNPLMRQRQISVGLSAL